MQTFFNYCRILYTLLVILSGGSALMAQKTLNVSPLPGKTYYASSIPFRFPSVPDAVSYRLQWRISEGMGITADWESRELSAPGTILSGLPFGVTVEWKYSALSATGAVIRTSPVSRFNIAAIPESLEKYRMRILKPAAGSEIYFLDQPGAAWDRKGNLVWFLPATKENNRIMDMRLNASGEISLVGVVPPYGRAISITPANDTLWDAHQMAGSHPLFPYLTFHHHFEWIDDTTALMLADIKPNQEFGDLNMGTGKVRKFPQVVVNMHRNGKINWIWEADKYLTLQDNDCYGHINSVAYNPKTQELILSMKDLSRIVVTAPGPFSDAFSLNGVNERTDPKLIAKSTPRAPVLHAPNAQPGKLQDFGSAPSQPNAPREVARPPRPEMKGIPGPFSGQHSVQFSPGGNLIFFNNNAFNPTTKYSTILELKKPVKADDDSEVVWEHILQFHDTLPKKAMGRGNIQLLPDGSIFTYMGQVSRLFESDTARNIQWMAYLEQNPGENFGWVNVPGYKASRASSLYPQWFTAEWLPAGTIDPVPSIRLSNLGTEQDVYSGMDTKGRLLFRETVPAGTQKIIPVQDSWANGIQVVSSLNPRDQIRIAKP